MPVVRCTSSVKLKRRIDSFPNNRPIVGEGAGNPFADQTPFIRAARSELNLERSGSPACALTALPSHITAYLGLHRAYVLQYGQARECLEEELSSLDNAQAKAEKAQAQIMLSWLLPTRGQLQKSLELLKDIPALFRETCDGWWYTLALIALETALVFREYSVEIKAIQDEAVRLLEKLGI